MPVPALPSHGSWIEISRSSLAHNLALVRQVARGARLAPVVKANAYGHGLALVGGVLAEAGAEWLCVNELDEVRVLREAGVDVPVYVLGPIAPDEAPYVAELGCDVVCSQKEVLLALAAVGEQRGRPIAVHLKVETGTHRQGIPLAALPEWVALATTHPGLRLAGITTHLASVEDETEHSFANVQLARFRDACARVPPGTLRHVAASAAALLLPAAAFDLVRPGIAIYGLWPSRETRIASQLVHGNGGVVLAMRPVMRWKTRIVQVQEADAGAWVGYGRTVRLERRSRLALLPVGYYDGYDRGLSGRGKVLVHQQLAPVRGRIAMNMTVVDVTDIPEAALGDEVLLLGPDHEATSVEGIASVLDTIPYEVTARLESRIPRILVP